MKTINKPWRLFIALNLALLLTLVLILTTHTNQKLFLDLNQWGTHFPASFWAGLTTLADGLYVFALFAIFLYKQPRLLLAGLLGGILCGLSVHLLKGYFGVARPPAVLTDFNIIGPGYRHGSFPSGHSATIFFFAGLVCAYSRSSMAKLLALCLAILAGLSRVMVGVHWPADVAFGGLIGWNWAYLSAFFVGHQPGVGKRVQGLLAVIITIAAIVMATKSTDYDSYLAVLILQYILAFISLVSGLFVLWRLYAKK
jgi:membrane-associated phospholipid phosphatase